MFGLTVTEIKEAIVGVDLSLVSGLTDIQTRRGVLLQKGMSYSEIALEEGVNRGTIYWTEYTLAVKLHNIEAGLPADRRRKA